MFRAIDIRWIIIIVQCSILITYSLPVNIKYFKKPLNNLNTQLHMKASGDAISSKGKVSVFGATGGLGQWCSKSLLDAGYAVQAVTRNREKCLNFDLLTNCNIIEADARVLDDSLTEGIRKLFISLFALSNTYF
jgi:hypothetical protein